jgi:hypothetical protein
LLKKMMTITTLWEWYIWTVHPCNIGGTVSCVETNCTLLLVGNTLL